MYFHDGKAGLTTTRTDFRGGDGQDTRQLRRPRPPA